LFDVLAVKGACLLEEHLHVQCWTNKLQPCSRTYKRTK
jgi:hypothetical protein